ncbi:hypothetical protein HGM15179_003913 [Zosterops borbonicus]|uniref:Uncharacterized protein n=1 Tax=Zosterops borbonicus TaxID=364589 RepID=A0A8K1GSF5_9PASS|nr:hypothetical protein HGM15179_003913 [Zosterops borbonicus]
MPSLPGLLCPSGLAANRSVKQPPKPNKVCPLEVMYQNEARLSVPSRHAQIRQECSCDGYRRKEYREVPCLGKVSCTRMRHVSVYHPDMHKSGRNVPVMATEERNTKKYHALERLLHSEYIRLTPPQSLMSPTVFLRLVYDERMAVIRAGFGINGLHLWSQDAHIFYKDDDHMLLQSTVILNLQQLYIFI